MASLIATDPVVIEAERLRVLRSFDVLDTDPEQAFDDVMLLAARICDAPIGMVSLAVGDRQWFKARDGVDACEIGRASSFSQLAMLQPGVTQVRDAALDPQFADHPLVTGTSGFRFYAGAPLIDDQGLALGALCVFDTRPRPEGLNETQLMTMDVLARQVMALLERRRALRERRRSDEAATAAVEAARLVTEKLAESDARFQAIADSMPQMVWSSRPDGHHDYYNARWYAFTGAAEGSPLGDAWGEMIHPEDQERARTAWRASLSTGEPYEVEYRLLHHTGSYAWTLSRAMPIRNAAGVVTRWFGTGTDIAEMKRLEQAKALLSQELSHRIKNIFAVISALLALSARQYPEAMAFAKAARTRISALARAHEFVRPHTESSRPSLDGTTLHAFLRDLFLPYDDNTNRPRVVISGEDADFDDQAATPVALLFHELATNAAKYGGLSVPEGRVTLTTLRQGDRYVMTWQEGGGPPLLGKPEGTGFGSSLLALSVEGQLGGRLEQTWAPGGLRVFADIPAAALTPRRAAGALPCTGILPPR
ncbi:MAG: PAS domain-containing protein [Brevundimonas sp.]|uniref:sensor histidine kinase n=1 Tax=Brevundimonas sp. TaxID=1871086 RepID=UPI0027199FEB|nr:PAS domain-containing protein [Brevundimonas sp.]MDO9587197.1 PAS domain-containing protein [Brevundimonas sp.]